MGCVSSVPPHIPCQAYSLTHTLSHTLSHTPSHTHTLKHTPILTHPYLSHTLPSGRDGEEYPPLTYPTPTHTNTPILTLSLTHIFPILYHQIEMVRSILLLHILLSPIQTHPFSLPLSQPYKHTHSHPLSLTHIFPILYHQVEMVRSTLEAELAQQRQVGLKIVPLTHIYSLSHTYTLSHIPYHTYPHSHTYTLSRSSDRWD